MAFVIFLVDMYCLGVKDIVVDIGPEAHYRKNVYEKLAARVALTRMKPKCAASWSRAQCSMPSTWSCRRTPITASPG